MRPFFSCAFSGEMRRTRAGNRSNGARIFIDAPKLLPLHDCVQRKGVLAVGKRWRSLRPSTTNLSLYAHTMKLNSLLFSAIAGALVFGAASRSNSQTDLDLPLASQAAQVKQRIAVTDITITYHRPLVNGRKIWGGLVPFGQVWRAGANDNTTIEFSTPVSIEGKPLPQGKYGLHMIPNPDTWTIIFSKMAVAWGSFTYNQGEDALRVNVKPRPIEMEEALE